MCSGTERREKGKRRIADFAYPGVKVKFEKRGGRRRGGIVYALKDTTEVDLVLGDKRGEGKNRKWSISMNFGGEKSPPVGGVDE